MVMIIAATAAHGPRAFAQEQEDGDAQKAEALIRDSIRARGGDAFLKVRTSVSRGQYTPFEKGASGLPMPFVDYIGYPDRERTEFGKGDRKYVQTNLGNSGWVYDAQQKMIREQTDEQVKRFQQGFRYDIDNVLRHGWKEQGVKLVYLGRQEPWRNTFSEAVRLEFADGATVTLHFDARTKLPLMSEYKTIDDGKTTNNQVRYYRWVDFDGIQFATLQDFYREGQQRARVSFDTVEFNVNLSDKLFLKPANIKEVK
jgi:hypothetical protein